MSRINNGHICPNNNKAKRFLCILWFTHQNYHLQNTRQKKKSKIVSTSSEWQQLFNSSRSLKIVNKITCVNCLRIQNTVMPCTPRTIDCTSISLDIAHQWKSWSFDAKSPRNRTYVERDKRKMDLSVKNIHFYGRTSCVAFAHGTFDQTS